MKLFQKRKLTVRHFATDILSTTLCSVILAVMFLLVTERQLTFVLFLKYFAVAQCIGLSIALPATFSFLLIKPDTLKGQLLLIVSCVVLGAIAGSYLATFLVDDPRLYYTGKIPVHMIIVSLMIGFIIVFGFVIYDNYNSYKNSVKDEKFKRLSIEKEKLNTELKLLQAQVEPHFLFNTLSNILSLLDSDVPKGKQMLENLTQYLRNSLVQSRKPKHTIADEMHMVRVFLEIYKIRMGDRLTFRIDVPDVLLDVEIPPMILQPLVENAVKHGIEPKIDGGEIRVLISRSGEMLKCEVLDTGVGITEKSSAGVGTGNIKKRLEAIWGDAAALYFEDAKPHGLKVVVEVPCE